MYLARALEIAGYQGEPVPNAFFQQDTPAPHVGILLPGAAYTCQMPLLYYPARLLLSLGADVLQVESDYSQQAGFQALPESERERRLFTEGAAACHAVLTQRTYKQITLIGKSISTLTMAHLLTTDATLAHAQAIWLTPLLWSERVRVQIHHWGGRSLFAVGTADPQYNAAYLSYVQAGTNGETVVINGANHSLEIEGDILRSLKAIEQVMRAVKVFLTQ